MVDHLEKTHPLTTIVAVGFSLGGNIVTKYMGEQEGKKSPRNVIGGISICQGYNAVEYVLIFLISFPIHFLNIFRTMLLPYDTITRNFVLI